LLLCFSLKTNHKKHYQDFSKQSAGWIILFVRHPVRLMGVKGSSEWGVDQNNSLLPLPHSLFIFAMLAEVDFPTVCKALTLCLFYSIPPDRKFDEEYSNPDRFQPHQVGGML